MTARLVLGTSIVGLILACAHDSQEPSGARPTVIELQAAFHTSCALLSNGTLWCWGNPIGGVPAASDFRPVQQPLGDSITAFALGQSSLCATIRPNATYCWGYWFPIDVSVSYGDQPTLLTDTLALSTLSAGTGHTCGILATGEPVCWGSSLLGKRGLGVPDPTLGSTTPNLVAGAAAYTAIAAGHNHTCGLVQSGGLVTCWGDATFLSDSSTAVQHGGTACFFSYASCALSPLLVTGVSSVQQLVAGPEGTCALAAALWCWGYFGTEYFSRPIAIPLPAAPGNVTVGNDYGCALTVTGQAYCWGRPGPWLGAETAGTSPTAVRTTLRFRSLAAGYEHTCGLTTTGQVYCWGIAAFGALGPYSDSSSIVPVRIRGPW